MSNIDVQCKKSEVFIEFSEAYQIVDIKNELSRSGQLEKIVYFKPVFPGINEGSLLGSVSENKFYSPSKRAPIIKKVARKLLQSLEARQIAEIQFDPDAVEDAIKRSDIQLIVTSLLLLVHDKKNHDGYQSIGKNEYFRQLLQIITHEFSLALDQDPVEVKSQILKKIHRN